MAASDPPVLDGCGCCEGVPEPEPVRNDPGLAALQYRVDMQPGFFVRMLQSLPLAPAEPGTSNPARPLARLLTRERDDPAVALLDAAACVADVLGFYQERIANEGFLRTATERRSVLELARAIGYELKPGVAAATYLAFTVEDAPGAPGICTIAAGTPVQSVPPQGKLPQVFETDGEIVARAEWNALAPRQTRPADLALLELAASGTDPATVLVLLGPAGSFPDGSAGLHRGLHKVDLFRLDPALPLDATVDALEVGRVFFATDAMSSAIKGGDLLLFVAKKDAAVATLVLRATATVAEPALDRVRVDLEPLPAPGNDPLPPVRAAVLVPYVVKPVLSFAKPQTASIPFTGAAIATAVASKTWRESDLRAMIGIQRWSASQLVQTIAAAAPADDPSPAAEAGAFAFGAKLGFFGNNAPRWGSLPKNATVIHDDPYPKGWDVGDSDGDKNPLLAAPRTVWEDSQGNAVTPHTYLERAVPDVNRASWAVFDAPDTEAQAFTVLDARETSRADFGLSGRAMRLRLADENGDPSTTPNSFKFRTSTAHVASRRLDLAELPIDAPIAAGDTQIELDRMVLGLSAGQPVALAGERADLPGVDAAEIALLADIVHSDGRSTLLLQSHLVWSYRRTSLRISANVVRAMHGESVAEVLGNGDASQPNQRFTLKKPPVTFVSATGGARSTLEVRVAGVLWDERPSLYDAGPDEPVYMTRIDDDAAMQLTFGDGIQGARLPSGTLNVAARYRSGIGPDGEVAAGTLTMLRAMPLGLRGVTNPVAATGAQGPERLADARRNAPLALLTFDRVVSLLDYEDFARAFPGIGKARGDVLWIDGAARIFLTVAGATGGLPGDEVLKNLKASIAAASDAAQRFDAAAYTPRYFGVTAKVAADPRRVAADVRAAVAAALIAGFGFDARGIGQSVTAAEVVTLIQGVAGVVAVDLDELLPYGDGPAPADRVPAALPAFGARRDAAGALQPAELLLVNPTGVVVEEMPT